MKIWPLVNSSRISAFGKTFSTNRISIRLIGKFEEIFRLQQVDYKSLDKFVGAAFMDLDSSWLASCI